MWRYDFHLFYMAARAILAGVSPYTVYDFNPPYPLALLFVPLSLLPELLAYLLYISGCVWLLWKVLGQKSLWPLLSFPVMFGLFVGQVDLPLALLMLVGGPWTYSLAIIKPQVGIVVLPWLLRRLKHDDWLKAIVPGLVLLTLSFLLRPTWLQEWLAILPAITNYAQRDSNLYWLVPSQAKLIVMGIGAIIALGFGLWARERREAWIVLHLFSPASNIYSASVLSEWIGPVEVALSWAAILLVGGDIHRGAPLFVVGASILVRYWLREYRTKQLNQKVI